MKIKIFWLVLVLFPVTLEAQTILTANGPGNTYELINSVFAPNGGDVVETPDCAHPAFGRHIRESWDATLSKYVFEFYMHVTPDNDRCEAFDRQRLEIKTYDQSPDHLKIVQGETVEYKWKFKLPTGFQVSNSFTHLHQIKPVGGDESTPIFALTARKGSPNKIELSYYPTTDLGLQKLSSTNLSLFEGQWVEVTERFRAAVSGGSYFIEIKNLLSGDVIMKYENNDISTYRSDNNFTRPKWGIYRSLNTPTDLRDEVVLFADFSIQELQNTITREIYNEMTDFKLFPNPAKNSVTLQIFSEKGDCENISVTGISGQKILSKQLNLGKGVNNITLDLSHFPTGTYFFTVDEKNTVRRLILSM